MTQIKVFTWATTWGLISLTSYPSSLASTQPSRWVNNSVQEPLMELQLAQQDGDDFDFQGDGRSGDRGGGGSRGSCPSVDSPLTALMPSSNWGKTVAERPTFWFYVPYTSQQAPRGEFVLQDEDRNEIYRVPFTLPRTPGLVSFSIPPTKNPLEIGKWYRWYFNLYCNRSLSPDFVHGWVQRITLTPSLERQLKEAEPREDKVYAAHGIWFDALAHLGNLRLTNSTDVALERDWSQLLDAKGVDLKLPSQAPMSGSITLVTERREEN